MAWFGQNLRDWPLVVTALGLILPFVAVVLANWPALRRSYRLMKALRTDEPHGGRWTIARETLHLLWQSVFWSWVYSRPNNIYHKTRLRIEHEIFWPRPQRSSAAYRKELQRWRKRLDNLYWHDGARMHSDVDPAGEVCTIRVKTCNRIYECKEAIGDYLKALKDIHEHDAQEFLSEVEVDSGFVAPLLLLTGLLYHFEDDWAPIIDAYGRDIFPHGDPLFELLNNEGLRRLQTFLFDCWLLWGPSIPICGKECYYWKGATDAIQYGYGDENNSIALVGDPRVLTDRVSFTDKNAGLAFRASARGKLKLAAAFIGTKESSEISSALSTVWNTDKGRRVVLDIRPQHAIKALSGGPNEAATYYSAYLWVLFIITDVASGRAIHLKGSMASPEDDRKQAWRSILPFFEHGNIADGETYAFLKRQLADKAASALNRIVEEYEKEWRKGDFPLKFTYACAIDDSGCGIGKAYGEPAGDIKLRTHIAEALKQYPALCDNAVVDFETYDPVRHPTNHPYSSCSLPGLLSKYYPYYTVDEHAAHGRAS
ncbi:MAG TPA: hypothetical protein VNU97_12680 [Rhizomicrobium sp.]|nr:hypothetical protein [Rhizomicrobium sp.]